MTVSSNKGCFQLIMALLEELIVRFNEVKVDWFHQRVGCIHGAGANKHHCGCKEEALCRLHAHLTWQ
jgi:hypothetical protein